VFDNLRKGIIGKAPSSSETIVMPVHPEEKSITGVTQLGDPLKFRGDRIEDIAMYNEISLAKRLMYIRPIQYKIPKLHGKHLI
jgi:hypothetical protein